MRYLSKFGLLHSNSCDNLLRSYVSKLQSFRLSVYSKPSKLHHFKKTAQTQTETKNLALLFDEIAQIFGTDNLISDKTSPGFSISRETHVENDVIREEHPYCALGVCENASDGVNLKKASEPVLGDTQLGNLGDRDVSPIVHKVTETVRGENGGVSMEEQLENLGFEFDVEVVVNVLKRCFKVPHLALRFFHWMKMRNGFVHSTKTYNTMIYIAGEAKDFRLVEELVEEMEKNSCKKDCKTWTILIMHYGKAKLIGKALLIFEKMRKSGVEPDVVVNKQMLCLLCRAGKADIAMEFYKEMVHKDIGMNLTLYKLLLKCLVQSGDIAATYLVLEDMIKISEIREHDAYACMLKSFCIWGRIREALELIRGLKHKNIALDAENFETLVKGLCRADMIDDALEIVDIMKKRSSVDGKVYGIIINGYLRRNDLSKAFDMFQSIKDSGHTPTTSTYTELMQHLFRLNEFQRASEIYHEMIEKGIEFDSVAVMAIVAGHIRQNRVSEAWEVLKSMEEKGIRATRKSYAVFIKELCKVSQADEIVNVLSKMKASNIIIGDDMFHWVRSYLEKKGEMENLEDVEQMQRASKLNLPTGTSSSLAPSYFSNLLDGKIRGNGISGNQELGKSLNSNKVEHQEPDSHLLKSYPNSYSEHDLQEICQILSSSEDWCSIQKALEKCDVKFTTELVLQILLKCGLYGHVALHFFLWVGKRDGYSHTMETYNMAIKISGRAKDFKHMRCLFFEMKRQGCTITSDTWTIMIMQYGRAGLTEIAIKNFREMKSSGCKPNGSTYKYLILSLCGRKGRKIDEAIATFQEMIRMEFVPDKELIEIYLECLCEAGKLSDARKCADLLTKAGFTVPLSYSLYARALCRAGRLEEASALVDEVGSKQHTLVQYTYGSIVHGLLRREQLEKALAKVESMKELGINPNVHVYTSLIVHFFNEKQIGKALEIFEKMKEEGCEPTIVTYSALIRGVGKSEEALQLISEMLGSGIVPSAINFRTVFFGLNREGKQNLADTGILRRNPEAHKGSMHRGGARVIVVHWNEFGF
ncbi:pentatricopeptide repeat (PPR) superfamily protein [Actinidia rufa]|uniref:Pentatricopeptide repeat (PPR) superfamily protein n=1 Tax=Actinidia rufa TaxID=165716 RepID=A0A7J0GEQ0_9ERIC|nr:pentatricopeptide repeat (PPR) superfamily protein [Actinidia rufa]